MTIGDMIALIMLYGKDSSSILGTSVCEIECTYDEICIYPTGESYIVVNGPAQQKRGVFLTQPDGSPVVKFYKNSLIQGDFSIRP